MTLNGMAVRTAWKAHHACGRRARKPAASHDLSARRPSERAGYTRLPAKAVEAGRRVRCQLLAAANDTLGLPHGDFAFRVENPARGIDIASWRNCRCASSQRGTEPVDLEEQGSDAASIHPATASGNPC